MSEPTQAEKLAAELEEEKKKTAQLTHDKMVLEAQVAEIMRQQYRD